MSWVIIWSGFLIRSSRLAGERNMSTDVTHEQKPILTELVVDLAVWALILLPEVLLDDFLRKSRTVRDGQLVLHVAQPTVGPSCGNRDQ